MSLPRQHREDFSWAETPTRRKGGFTLETNYDREGRPKFFMLYQGEHQVSLEADPALMEQFLDRLDELMGWDEEEDE